MRFIGTDGEKLKFQFQMVNQYFEYVVNLDELEIVKYSEKEEFPFTDELKDQVRIGLIKYLETYPSETLTKMSDRRFRLDSFDMIMFNNGFRCHFFLDEINGISVQVEKRYSSPTKTIEKSLGELSTVTHISENSLESLETVRDDLNKLINSFKGQ